MGMGLYGREGAKNQAENHEDGGSNARLIFMLAPGI